MESSFVFEGSLHPSIHTCHAGMLYEYRPGEFLAAWFGGEFESSSDSVILTSKYIKEKGTWSQPKVTVNVYKHAAGNPRIFRGPDNALWLIVPINYGKWCAGGSELFLKRSFDDGESWTDLERFCPEYKVLGKNKPIRLTNGTWIIPLEYEPAGDVCFLYSDDNGSNWNMSNVDSGDAYLDQPTVVENPDSSLLAYMRSWDGLIFQTRSKDFGKTWTKAEPTALRNNNSGIDMTILKSGKLILAHNPTALGSRGDVVLYGDPKKVPVRYLIPAFQDYISDLVFDEDHQMMDFSEKEGRYGYPSWGPRTPLVLSVSDDNGNHWHQGIVLEDKPGEYSYPCVIQDSAGLIHVFYTWNRVKMKHVQLCEAELA